MTTRTWGRTLWAVVAGASLALVLSGSGSRPAHADGAPGDDNDPDEGIAQRGLDIAPVPLNLDGKRIELVGRGSYLVNAVAACSMCHSAGVATEFAAGGNPYFKGSQPKVVNPATYLGGGRVFTPPGAGNPPIVARNLTPDRTGRPIGGMAFDDFVLVMRTGTDLDHVHPNCSATITTGCYPATQPYDGDLLQVMPWPELQSLSLRDLRAIYEYLSAVPCITGPAAGLLHNDCT